MFYESSKTYNPAVFIQYIQYMLKGHQFELAPYSTLLDCL